jgi:hypothetical protein
MEHVKHNGEKRNLCKILARELQGKAWMMFDG